MDFLLTAVYLRWIDVVEARAAPVAFSPVKKRKSKRQNAMNIFPQIAHPALPLRVLPFFFPRLLTSGPGRLLRSVRVLFILTFPMRVVFVVILLGDQALQLERLRVVDVLRLGAREAAVHKPAAVGLRERGG